MKSLLRNVKVKENHLNADSRRCNANGRRYPEGNLRESALDLRVSALKNILLFLRKSIVCLLCVTDLCLSTICCANEENPYKAEIDKMVETTGELEAPLKANDLNYASYSNWFENFRSRGRKFEKSFTVTHGEKESFKLAKDAIKNFSAALQMFYQVQDAEKLFNDTIASGDAGYAHKWKDSAITARNKAIDAVTQAIDSLKRAQSSAASE